MSDKDVLFVCECVCVISTRPTNSHWKHCFCTVEIVILVSLQTVLLFYLTSNGTYTYTIFHTQVMCTLFHSARLLIVLSDCSYYCTMS